MTIHKAIQELSPAGVSRLKFARVDEWDFFTARYGLGLEIHEHPRYKKLRLRIDKCSPLSRALLSGRWGARLEDVVLVTKNRAVEFCRGSQATGNLKELPKERRSGRPPCIFSALGSRRSLK